MMRTAPTLTSVTFVVFMAFNTGVFAAPCSYNLGGNSNGTGTAKVRINGNQLTVTFKNAASDSLYTIWIDHKNRATGELAADYPLDKGALERGVAPAFATTAGVFAGMALDANGVITNGSGDAILNVTLDYDLLALGDSPVVGAELATQGLNRVGGGWLRDYPEDPNVQASLQKTDETTGRPLVHRSTAQGITIQYHPDKITHGHTPGVGGVDHSSAFKGDFAAHCLP